MIKTLAVQALVGVVGAACACGAALAKLPPPSDEVKAAAAATAEKGAWSNKVGAYQLCKAQDKAAVHYLSSARSAGKDVKPPAQTPACADPGPFVAKPVEVAGANSPATPASNPPSTKQPDAVVDPVKKP